jgi:hypothetical protein
MIVVGTGRRCRDEDSLHGRRHPDRRVHSLLHRGTSTSRFSVSATQVPTARRQVRDRVQAVQNGDWAFTPRQSARGRTTEDDASRRLGLGTLPLSHAVGSLYVVQ